MNADVPVVVRFEDTVEEMAITTGKFSSSFVAKMFGIRKGLKMANSVNWMMDWSSKASANPTQLTCSQIQKVP